MEPNARHHVLVVEDDAELRGALRAVLDSEGCPNSGADSGESALTLIEQGLEPCIVLLDVRMPGISASEFLDRLREFPGGPSVPVVLITGSDVPTALAVDGILRKPFSPETLMRVVEKHCACSVGRTKVGGDPHPHPPPRKNGTRDQRGEPGAAGKWLLR